MRKESAPTSGTITAVCYCDSPSHHEGRTALYHVAQAEETENAMHFKVQEGKEHSLDGHFLSYTM